MSELDDLFNTGKGEAASFSVEAIRKLSERLRDPEYLAAERRLTAAQNERLWQYIEKTFDD